MVIDREFLAEQIWGQTMVPAYSFVPPGIGNYGEPAYADYKDMSPIEREDKAKALLGEAGFGPGLKPLKVEIRYNTTDNNQNTLVAIAEQWKVLGVETTLVNTDAKTHFAYLRDGGDFDVGARRLDRRLFRPAELPVPGRVRQRGPQLRALEEPRIRRPDEARPRSRPTWTKRAKILFAAETILMRERPTSRCSTTAPRTSCRRSCRAGRPTSRTSTRPGSCRSRS